MADRPSHGGPHCHRFAHMDGLITVRCDNPVQGESETLRPQARLRFPGLYGP